MTNEFPERSEILLQKFAGEFEQITGLTPRYDDDFHETVLALCDFLSDAELLEFKVRRSRFLAHVNRKFRVNAEGLKRFYALAARRGCTFNYHEKNEVQLAFDICSEDILRAVLERTVSCAESKEDLLGTFQPAPHSKTITVLQSECGAPSRLRRPKGNRDVEREILQSQFGAFIYCTLDECYMHQYFDSLYREETYRSRFWNELHARSPHLFNRDHALYIAHVDSKLFPKNKSYIAVRDHLCAWLADIYDQLNNYSYVALFIDPITMDGRRIQCELAADIILFGEKHREIELQKAYFRWKDVRKATIDYIERVDVDAARFDLANEGFTYKDCFILAPEDTSPSGEESLLLLFQKNERDETVIPCPACRSHDVQGNSYSSLGVRSWECNNLLCPDRSKYNRGKRYSFKGLLMQQSIDDEKNEVSSESVRSWLRDVQIGRSNKEVFEVLLRHYSLHGDTVHIFNWTELPDVALGRNIHQSSRIKTDNTLRVQDFFTGPFFKRYLVHKKTNEKKTTKQLGDDRFRVLLGDAHDVLSELPKDQFDAAVTSPPYYNAREYSQWDNIYCYLYDMFNIAAEVCRCLKPGAFFLYNIFDYFDNERSVVFSAMGQKRMILSAYTVDMFRRIGLRCVGNIAWDKGDIEGKRGFNAGNYSPYYQSPFNCWEHILIFQKPMPNGTDTSKAIQFPAVLKAQPVIKMVGGKNTHGHTAPFPDELPALIIRQLPKDAIILDPFAGSLTTGRVAERFGLCSYCIEKNIEYCELGLAMREDERTQQTALQKQLNWGF